MLKVSGFTRAQIPAAIVVRPAPAPTLPPPAAAAPRARAILRGRWEEGVSIGC